MNLKNIIATTIANAVGRKYSAKIGKKFGLSSRQITMIVTAAAPFVISAAQKALRTRKKGRKIKNHRQ